MKNSFFILWFFVLLLLFNSCNLDELRDIKISDEVKLNPTIVSPVATANITVWDLIKSANTGNEAAIDTFPDGLVKIVYKQDDLFKYNIRELLAIDISKNFSAADKELGTLNPGDISLDKKFSLGDLIDLTSPTFDALRAFNNQTQKLPAIQFNQTKDYKLGAINEFSNINIESGILKISVENKLRVSVTVGGILWDKGFNSEIGTFSVADIQPNSTKSSNPIILPKGLTISNDVVFRLQKIETKASGSPVLINLDDYFNMNFNLVDLQISKGKDVTIDKQQKLDLLIVDKFGFEPGSNIKAFKAMLTKGKLTINTTNETGLTGIIDFNLTSIKKIDGSDLPTRFSLSGATTVDLAGSEIDFTQDKSQPYNSIPYTYSLTIDPTKPGKPISYDSKNKIKMNVTLTGLEFKWIEGDFGQQKIDIDPGEIDMNVEMLDKIDGKFTLDDPRLKITFNNPIGMPAQFDMKFTASNKKGETVILKKNDNVEWKLPEPENMNEPKIGSISIDKGNSNIVDFIALPPSGKIKYQGNVSFNQGNVVTEDKPNFLDLDNFFTVGMEMEMPMAMKISNLMFKDTSSITGSDYDKVESATLILTATNEIPLDVSLQLIFLNAEDQEIWKTESDTLLAGKGITDELKSQKTEFELTKDDMINLRKAKSIVFVGIISSPNNGAEVAKILSTNTLKLNVAIKSKVNL